MIEKERQELMDAADHLEELADRTTGGHWRISGLLASRPGVIAEGPDGRTEHVADARSNTAQWIAALSPVLARPLAAWLRSAAEAAPISPQAVAFVRALTSRHR